METKTFSSVEALIRAVRDDYRDWMTDTRPWFRGEPNVEATHLMPKLYRPEYSHLVEIDILRRFRSRGPLFVDYPVPQQGHTDQWLFLAQHSGLPTRLLDWSESLLIALYFSLNHNMKGGGTVWMLNPIKLNSLTAGPGKKVIDDPLTWFVPELDLTNWLRLLLKPDERVLAKNRDVDFRETLSHGLSSGIISKNAGSMNIRAAWERKEELGTQYPIAIHPTYIHSRIIQQLSRFTIWGQNKASLSKMKNIDTNVLRMYKINPQKKKMEEINKTLRLLGITRASLFPDLDSIAADITKPE